MTRNMPAQIAAAVARARATRPRAAAKRRVELGRDDASRARRPRAGPAAFSAPTAPAADDQAAAPVEVEAGHVDASCCTPLPALAFRGAGVAASMPCSSQ